MRNYRIINDYKIINRINYYVNYNVCNSSVIIEDLKSNLYYLIWVGDYSAICFDRNPSNITGTGYMRLLGEAYVFEEDDLIPYIYK